MLHMPHMIWRSLIAADIAQIQEATKQLDTDSQPQDSDGHSDDSDPPVNEAGSYRNDREGEYVEPRRRRSTL